MSAERGVPIRFTMPDPEHRAIERVAAARNCDDPAGLVAAAIVEWTDAGCPPLDATAPPLQLDADSLNIWRIVRWWLRRSPATEVLAPALLAGEARAAEAARDRVRMDAAFLQLRRIACDLSHPQRREAIDLLLAMIPEPERSRLMQAIGGAETAATFKARGGTA